MSLDSLINKATEISTFGLVEDITGSEAAQAAAREAAGIQAGAAEAGIAETRRQFDVTQETLRPTIEAGDLARQQQLALLGLSGVEAQETAFAGLQESPAQQFLRKRAEKSLLQNASAIGGLGGGNIRSALVEQGVGFASQDIESQLARLQGLSAPGTQTAVQQGTIGGQTAGQIAQLTGQAGAATASGILGAGQVGAQTTQQLLGLGALGLGAFTGGASLPATQALSGQAAPGFGVKLL